MIFRNQIQLKYLKNIKSILRKRVFRIDDNLKTLKSKI